MIWGGDGRVNCLSANIFISFASQDRKVADTLCSALESRGFSCWISSRDIAPGDNFQSAIVRAIRGAKMMLLVFTANSNASDEMSKELALASQQKLIVVPLRVEDVAPNEAFAYEFATRQWIDFFADWEAAINQLSARIAQAMPPEAPAAPAVVAPPPAPAVVAPPPAPEPVAEARPAPSVKAPVAEPPKPEPAAAPKAPEPKLEAKPASEAKPAPEAKRPADGKPAPVPPPKPAVSAKPASAEGETPPARKSPVGLLVGIGAAAVLVIGVVIALPMLTGKKTSVQASIAHSAAPRAAASPASGAAAAQSQASAAASTIAADSASPQAVSAAVAATDSSMATAAKPRSHRTHVVRASAKTDVPY